MEIKVGNISLTAHKEPVVYMGAEVTITIDIGENQKNHIFDVSASELKAAIEALEKSC